MQPLRSVTVVGVGLIGGSIGLALRKRRLAESVVGVGSRSETLATALKLGAITEIATDLKSSVAQAELVVVCAPVSHVADLVRQLAPGCRPGTLITDAGSTKAQIVADVQRAATEPSWNPQVHFVGSHPLAGNEKKGPVHADADLLVGRLVIVTPAAGSRDQDVQAICRFWESLGARTARMSAEEHDVALAATSHLPHLVASALAGATPEGCLNLTASGWLDTTRIAAGDPMLWQQIMLANRENLLASLASFEAQIGQWRQALDAADTAALERLLAAAKRIRDAAGG